MQPKSKLSNPTMFYEYGNNEKEFVFVVKGRPFPCLVSPYLPTPTATLLDYNLVRDLGLKMTDLQCQKFSFAGFKMRILGKVSVTVQNVHDGVSFGAFHIKGNVVLDLSKNLDTECVAGTKMAAQLRGDTASPTPTRSAPSPAPSVPAARTPRTPPPRAPRTPQSPPRSPPSSPPRSPPGFPPRPQYTASPCVSSPDPRPSIPVFSVSSDGRELSPRTANVRALTLAFKDADIKPDLDEETFALEDADSDGDLADDADGNIVCYLSNGLLYQYGHGRDRCTRLKCANRNQYKEKEVPSNCGYNQHWRLPPNFSPCGDLCQGGFCRCLHQYHGEKVKKGKKKK